MQAIWDKRSEDPFTLAPITLEEIKQVEQTIQRSFPHEYIAQILEKNGGVTRFNAIRTGQPTEWAEDHVNVEFIYGIGKNEGILDSPYFIKEWGLPEDVLLLTGTGHAWIVLDYRTPGQEPHISYIDVESEQDFIIAGSFKDFVSRLYVHEYDDEELEDDHYSWTETQAEEILKEKDIETAFPLIHFFNYHTVSTSWWLGQLEKLAQTCGTHFQDLVAESLFVISDLYLDADREHLRRIAEQLDHTNPDVRHWLTLMEENIAREERGEQDKES
ncbi:SMI1/KNR4 family protein [Paenalkalicoccus suaedae]|uniref:SMI1/KNR4 family protein n=1 Tax=Paenalkalicoccus suaedae TaxID=2592382 RepID=A0A859FBB5_9BACI|nr:SMI1/KNR4 family protein [Paenalkalicoccus suaedae]QKS69834.1 SMI1/KNR4 family protein [Paenalkalicoccus suaedae]